MAKRHEAFKLGTGIDLYTGDPGSGKSYLITRRVIERSMLTDRRPVYTNLPLKWRVLRKWLRDKGGEPLADLLVELTEESFVRFMERYVASVQFKEQLKADRPGITRKQQRAAWLEHAGPDITRGPDLNWIPPTAHVVVDECHHWFPNPALQRGERKVEPECLMSYLTMHRHMLHQVWFATQAERQVSNTIKTLMRRVWVIHPRDEDKIVYGLRFKHIGVKALGYVLYSREQYSNPPGQRQPSENFSIMPALPWNAWVFRFYTSETHAGSGRELTASLRRHREEAGLLEGGQIEVREDDMPRRSIVRSSLGFMFRWTIRAAAIVLAMVIGGMFVAGGMNGGDDQYAERIEAIETKLEEIELNPAQAIATTVARDMVVKSITPQQVRFRTGEKVTLGGYINGMQLLGVDVKAGVALFDDVAGGTLWVCRIGEQASRLGTHEEVRRAIAGLAGGEGPSEYPEPDASLGPARVN